MATVKMGLGWISTMPPIPHCLCLLLCLVASQQKTKHKFCPLADRPRHVSAPFSLDWPQLGLRLCPNLAPSSTSLPRDASREVEGPSEAKLARGSRPPTFFGISEDNCTFRARDILRGCECLQPWLTRSGSLCGSCTHRI